MSRFGDILVEHGPITQDYVASPGLSSDMRWIRAVDLNELRDELIAARALKELLGRVTVEPALVSGYTEGLLLVCDRSECPWTAEYDATTDLAELVRRAREHAEVCR